MSEAEKLFEKLEKMPIEKILSLCALAIEEKMEERRLDIILLLTESRLTKYRTLKRLGMKAE